MNYITMMTALTRMSWKLTSCNVAGPVARLSILAGVLGTRTTCASYAARPNHSAHAGCAAWEGGLEAVGAFVAPLFFFGAIDEDDEVGTHTTKELICDTHYPCLARQRCRGKPLSMGPNESLCDSAQGTCMGQRAAFQ
jgi:hypothetical protein